MILTGKPCFKPAALALLGSTSFSTGQLALLVERIATYYPRSLGKMALHVGVAATTLVWLRAWHLQREGIRT
jgi:hypothetical protein